MRTILIGDIHGCYDEFISLLGVTKFNKKKDRLVILGDFIDKGPKSFDVLKYLSELKDEMNDNLIVLEGNHEYHFKYRGHNIFKKMPLQHCVKLVFNAMLCYNMVKSRRLPL